MQSTKITLISIWILLIFGVACNKNQQPPLPTCNDGFMNNGETGLDCGGPCSPCAPITNPVFIAAFNGQFINFPIVNVQYGDTIFMNASTDSVQVHLIFKNLSIPDESNQLNPLVLGIMPLVSYNGVNYANTNPQYSVVTISEDEDQKLSGLFQLFLPHGLNNMDTLKVINGAFMNIPY